MKMQSYVHDINFVTIIGSEDAELHLKILFSWAVILHFFPLIHLNFNTQKSWPFYYSINPAVILVFTTISAVL
jgi:hypothetical protein